MVREKKCGKGGSYQFQSTLPILSTYTNCIYDQGTRPSSSKAPAVISSLLALPQALQMVTFIWQFHQISSHIVIWLVCFLCARWGYKNFRAISWVIVVGFFSPQCLAQYLAQKVLNKLLVKWINLTASSHSCFVLSCSTKRKKQPRYMN